MFAPQALLEIKSLVLPVHLGVSSEEREKKQQVAFNITVAFKKIPKDAETDKLQDSVCYYKICDSIKLICSSGSFCLIEKLASDILKELKKYLPSETRIRVSVHKIEAPVPHLEGGVSYTCGDYWNLEK